MELQEFWTNKMWRYALLGIIVIAAVGNIALFIAMRAYDATVMDIDDPLRKLIPTLFWYVFGIPHIPLLLGYQASKQVFLAPRGKYIAGQKYKLLTTRRWASIGIMTALYVAFSWGLRVGADTPAGVVSMAGTYFGPFEAYMVMYLGDIFRIGITGEMVTIWSFAWWNIDAVIWMVNGAWWFAFVEPHIKEKTLPLWFALWVFQGYMCHSGYFALGMIWGPFAPAWGGPMPLLLTEQIRWWFVFNPGTSLASAIFGLITIALFKAQHIQPWTELVAGEEAAPKPKPKK
jgi:hypothetical protein